MILICDDNEAIIASLSLILKRAGYQTAKAANPLEAINFLRQQTPSLVIMDMNYSNSTSGEEGLELLARIRILCPEVPVILITAWASIDLAVKGMKLGAFDFVAKPWNNLVLLNTIKNAIIINNDSKDFDKNDGIALKREKVIGSSDSLKNIFNTISRIAASNAPVLITGESGTGKELIAEVIHDNSKRIKEPFIKVNLGGISQSLFESEMFGHVKGAFTDAHYNRVGRFEMANKGTIFLDEIGELDLISQVKLLRVLQDQTFEALGDSMPRRVDTRVISATNRDLNELIANGKFREDLFYRINLIMIHVPPLRERKEDIGLLADHFAKKYVETNNLNTVAISADAVNFLEKQTYPGNIRELKNLVERTILVSQKEVLSAEDFEKQLLGNSTRQMNHLSSFQSLEEIEKKRIIKALENYKGNIARAAKFLGFSRQSLYRRIKKYDIIIPNDADL